MDAQEHLEFARAEWNRRARKNARLAAWTNTPAYDEGAVACANALLQDIPVGRSWRCLDIGCGPGRLMRQLAPRVGKVVGCDVSPVMVMAGRRETAELPNCVVLEVDGDGLPASRLLPQYDFVYSVLTFQHNPPEVWSVLLADASRIAKVSAFLRVQFYVGPQSDSEVLSFPVTRDEAVAGIEGAGWEVVAEHVGLVNPNWLWVTGRKG
jgi:SAM-dependent methyltransferase